MASLRVLVAAATMVAAVLPHRASCMLLREGSAERPARARAFEEFARRHGKQYTQGSSEYARRLALFERAAAEVERQNAQPQRLWSAALNRLADRTDEELAALRGYQHGAHPEARVAMATQLQLLGRSSRSSSLEDLPSNFTWQGKLQATREVQDQSSCGSCWAFAASTVLRGHSELYQKDRKFSVQQIVSCTANPMQCGGDGGCRGATAELAMDYVFHNGCETAAEWGYAATDSGRQCRKAEAAFQAGLILAGAKSSAATLSVATAGSPELHVETAGRALGRSLGLQGYRKLPENELAPLMLALYERGPVAVSVAAGRTWNIYQRGIFDACERDAIIDHAVTLVGYGVGREGVEQGHKYWQIQNSWGPAWGESGFIRLARKFEDSEEAQFCGTDRKPWLGSGCRGGPKEVTVCGSCGILYDTVVPEFTLAPSGLWSTERLARVSSASVQVH